MPKEKQTANNHNFQNLFDFLSLSQSQPSTPKNKAPGSCCQVELLSHASDCSSIGPPDDARSQAVGACEQANQLCQENAKAHKRRHCDRIGRHIRVSCPLHHKPLELAGMSSPTTSWHVNIKASEQTRTNDSNHIQPKHPLAIDHDTLANPATKPMGVFLGPRPGKTPLAAVTLLVHVMSSAGVDLGISQLFGDPAASGRFAAFCRTRGVSTNAMSLFTLWELLTIASIDLANARPGNLLKILGF